MQTLIIHNIKKAEPVEMLLHAGYITDKGYASFDTYESFIEYTHNVSKYTLYSKVFSEDNFEE